MVKTALKIIAVLLFLSGSVWIFQGVGVLPGSYMSGDPQWAVNGTVTALVGIILFWAASRK